MPQTNKFLIGLAFTLLQINSCMNPKPNCADVKPDQKFQGTGYIVYKENSQDGQREILFFPVCISNDPSLNDSSFLSSTFKSGISFHLPLTSQFYKVLSLKSRYLIDETNTDIKQKVFYNHVEIEFSYPVNSSHLYNSSKKNEDWNYYISSKGKSIKLKYFISNESHLYSIKVLKS